MTLGACKGEVKKLIGTPKTPRARPSSGASSAHSPSLDALSREVRRIASTEMPLEAVPARDALVHRLSALLRTTTPPSDLATAAASAVCAFHEDLWSATLPLHTALNAQAREKLAPLKTVVTAKVFADLIDEHTRQAVRALAPGVAVEPIWKALGTGASR